MGMGIEQHLMPFWQPCFELPAGIPIRGLQAGTPYFDGKSMNIITRMKIAAIAIAAGSVYLPVGRAENGWGEERFVRAQTALFEASEGNDDKIEPAFHQFEELLKAAPGNPVFHAYHGAAVALKSRTTFLPWKKLRYAEQGVTELDAVLGSLQPDHDIERFRDVPYRLETQLVAADTFMSLPASFHRFEQGAKLLEQIMNHPAYSATPDSFRSAVLLALAKLAAAQDQPGQYRNLLLRVVALNERGPYGSRALALLGEIPR